MSIFDITDKDLSRETLNDMASWLALTVGETIGNYSSVGEGLRVGYGWEIRIAYYRSPSSGILSHKILVDITDEEIALLFALKWL